eukprot:8941198-Karenia_brevis.AAC.1
MQGAFVLIHVDLTFAKQRSPSCDCSKYGPASLGQVGLGLIRKVIEAPATYSDVTTSILPMFSTSMGWSGMRRHLTS